MLIKVSCSNCGKFLYKSQAELNRTNNSFCSKKCLNSFRSNSYLGKNNPANKCSLNASCIYNLTHNGAYILGLIWSDGHLTDRNIQIVQHKEASGDLLGKISYMLYGEDICYKQKIDSGIKTKLTICSKELVEYILSLGGINLGKKSATLEFPNIPEKFHWSFICGVFDGDGGFEYNYTYPIIKIRSNAIKFLKILASKWNVEYNDSLCIKAYGYKALDICGKMYADVSLCHEKKYHYYVSILNWHPKNLTHEKSYIDTFKVRKLDKKAVIPFKNNVTDSGYDISVVAMEALGEGVYMCDTKLAVEPPLGYYFDLVGRSSLPKKNFHFLGGVGIIDRSYVGPLKLILQQIDTSKELPELPFVCAQIIPRQIVHFDILEVDELSESTRGMGGFGSTDNTLSIIPSDMQYNLEAVKAKHGIK